MYIAWDTETTGLPLSRHNAKPENTGIFDKCRIVSIAFTTFTERGRELDSCHKLVIPDGFNVTGTEIHGITHDMAVEKGEPFQNIYDHFVNLTKKCTTFVAHNSNFDENAFFSECYRRGLSVEPFKNINFQCTYKLCKKVHLKSMKLINLYKHIFGKEFEGAHNALADCRACGEVYPHLTDPVKELKNIHIPKVVLKASEVASMIGLNQYKKPDEVLNILWSKYAPESFKGKTKDQKACEIIENNEMATSLLNTATQFVSSDSHSVENKFRAIKNQIEKLELDNESKGAVNDYIRKTLYTNHGIKHEDNTATQDMKVDDKFYRYDVCEIKGTRYVIVGRIDRFREDEGVKTLIEIKNRTRGLFNNVRDYEQIQCQTYMEMLNIEKCELIEQYNDEKRVYFLQRDQERWNEQILPKLKHFCECFHNRLS